MLTDAILAPSADRAQRAARDAALFARYRRDRSPAVRDALVERHLPLARHLARRYHAQAEREDLEQVAALALLKAIERFDSTRGIAFTTYAVPTIVGELKRYFRDHGWVVRVPRPVQELKQRLDAAVEQLTAAVGRSPTAAELAERTGATLEQVLEALAAASAHHPDSLDRPATEDGDPLVTLSGSVDPGFARAEDAADLGVLLNRLAPRERAILQLRFEEDLTQAEIGRRFGLSQMHVSRLTRQAITTLQEHAGA